MLIIKTLFRLSLIKKNPVLFFLIMTTTTFYSQVPTIQDCLGAIPLCNNSYAEVNSPVGSGNYPDETNYWSNIGGCYIEEDNSVWYTFNVSQSGMLEFEITPNDPYDDYDWMLFDLTNASCSDIYNDPSLVVSCNSFGLFFGQNGPTGISSNLGGIGNSNGPGDSNGPPFNADLPVTAGEQYALLISNHSGSTNGYQIDFQQNPGNAVIYDNVPPTFAQMSNIACGSDTLTITFSEPILCSSISTLDFQLLDPTGGIITINNIQSAACSSGANFGTTFTFSLGSTLITAGTYQLVLNTNNGSIEDACGNLALGDTLSTSITEMAFNTSALSILNELCSLGNGEITGLTISGGTPPYVYSWDNGATTLNNSGLAEGTYQISVSDLTSCPIDTSFYVPSTPGVTLDTTNLQVISDICSEGTGEITGITHSGGTPPYTFQWKDNSGNIINTSTSSASISNLSSGTYTLELWDQNNCSDSLSVFVPLEPGVFLDATSMVVTDDQCFQSIGSISNISASGGTPGYQFTWTEGGNIINTSSTTSDISNLTSGQYELLVSDVNNCTDSILVTVGDQSNLQLDSTGLVITPDTCNNQIGSISGLSVLGGTLPYSSTWTDQNGAIYPGNLDQNQLEGGMQYTLFVSDSNGCDVSASFTVPNEGFQDNYIISVLDASCNTNDGAITVEVITSQSPPFIYSIDNWNTTSGSNIFNNLAPGNYTVNVQDGYGCLSTQNVQVLQDSIPSASFNSSTTSGEAPILIEFTNTSTNASNYSWYINDTYTSNLTDYAHQFMEEGNYNITLIALNSPNCMDSTNMIINILPDFRIYVPNAFTPDNDGINDQFEIVFDWDYEIDMEVSIFNKWGELIFEGSSTNSIWDGTYNGVSCEQGSYIWKVEYIHQGSIVPNTLTGHVMLIR